MGSALISVIVPVYNERENIELFHRELEKVIRSIRTHKFELVFVDDGSKDGTATIVKTLAEKHDHVRLVEFVRNFGKEAATTAGLAASKGDAAIMVDGDLQHPLELIPHFIEKWQAGAEVVVGIRKASMSETRFKRFASKMFYRILNRISGTNLVPNTTDFQLLDRAVIDEFIKFTERGRMTRGLISWLGFRTDYIHFDAKERQHGIARYSTVMLMQLAINTFVSLSLFPLRMAGYIGVLISSLSLPIGLYMYLDKVIFNDPFGFGFSGTAFLAVMILFLVGIVLMSLGLIALYIGAIHGEVINRPLYVVRNNK